MMLLLKGGGALATTLFRSSLFTTQRRRCFCVSNMSKPVLPKFVPVKGEDSISRNTSRSSSNPHGCKFRIVSYNILAQVYVKSSIFPYSPKPSLRWKARSEEIMTVLKSLDADFLCLQELDEYNTFYKGNIESNDYSSIYAQRSGDKRDGCGIFYKHSSAELVLEEKIEYNDLVDSLKYRDSSLRVKKHDDAPSSGSIESPLIVDLLSKNDRRDHGDLNDPRVRLKRDCVGLMTAFKLKDHSGHLVIVANTHLYWNPELADVKLAQAKYLLLRLAQFKEIISENFECMPSVIVCGDFNSTPGDKVYEYLVSGNCSSMLPVDNSGDLPMPLCSLHAFLGEEPLFTNCTPDFTNTLDYIFFAPSGRLKPLSCIELPGLKSPDVVGGLPNYYHPSDHLPIGCDFQVLEN